MKGTIWISYDLGVRGDYENLYVWLDSHRAKECGDSVAVLTYRYEGSLPDRLKADLTSSIATDKRTRIYVVYRDSDSGKLRGKFILGGRRAAAWSGYGGAMVGAADEEVE
jgi:hypothetical protein